MAQPITLGQMKEWTQHLSPEEQSQLREHLDASQRPNTQDYADSVRKFLAMCLENPIPGDGRNAEQAIRALREERGLP